MSSKVLLKKSSVTGKVPLASDLSYGELAINYTDGVLYYKKSDDTVQQVGISSGSSNNFTYDTVAPESPQSGDVWVDSNNGIQYIYIDDGDSAQWVELGLSVAEGITPGGTQGQVLVKASSSDYDTEWVTPDSFSGISGFSGYSGFSGISGYSGYSGMSGYSGVSGYSGTSGFSGFSGMSGATGLGFTIAKTYSSVAALTADTSPTGIIAGQFAIIDTNDVENPEDSRLYLWNGSSYQYTSDLSGAQGIKGESGFSGYSGFSGISGYSGFSGYSGLDGTIGSDGASGYSGTSGYSGFSGYSGLDGTIGSDGASGFSGYSGFSGISGYSGFSGYSGTSGYSGFSGISGYSGYSGLDGTIGSDGASGYSGTSGYSGFSGYSGLDGSPWAGGTFTGDVTLSTGTLTAPVIAVSGTNETVRSFSGIESWVYTKEISVAAQTTEARGIFFSHDGLNMYIIGNTGGTAVDAIIQYTLATAWDIATAVYVSMYSLAVQGTSPFDVYFKPEGDIFYIVDGTVDTVYRYDMSTAWDITTATYVNSFSVTAEETDPNGIWFSSDGLNMYITGTVGDDVNQYVLSTAWDITTAVYATVFSVSAYSSGPQSVALSESGEKMWVLETNNARLLEYSLSTPWSISTATLNGYVSTYLLNTAVSSGGSGLFINETQGVAYICDYNSDKVLQLKTNNISTSIEGPVCRVLSEARFKNNIVVYKNLRVEGTLYGINNGYFGSSYVSNYNAASTTGTTNFATNHTTGAINIGGTTATGVISVGISTAAQTLNLATGATTSGTTKTVNIGTAGVSGSTTAITIGSVTSGATNRIGVGITPVANNGILQIGGVTALQAVLEKITVSATAATGTINFDVLTQGVLYYTTSASGNWVFNIRGNSTTTLNTIMQTGQTCTIVFMNTNGATAYYPTSFTIDSTAVTVKWLQGVVPSFGNASAIDMYTYSIIKTGTNAYTVIGSQTKYA